MHFLFVLAKPGASQNRLNAYRMPADRSTICYRCLLYTSGVVNTIFPEQVAGFARGQSGAAAVDQASQQFLGLGPIENQRFAIHKQFKAAKRCV